MHATQTWKPPKRDDAWSSEATLRPVQPRPMAELVLRSVGGQQGLGGWLRMAAPPPTSRPPFASSRLPPTALPDPTNGHKEPGQPYRPARRIRSSSPSVDLSRTQATLQSRARSHRSPPIVPRHSPPPWLTTYLGGSVIGSRDGRVGPTGVWWHLGKLPGVCQVRRRKALTARWVGPVGLEPTTRGLKVRCSASLS